MNDTVALGLALSTGFLGGLIVGWLAAHKLIAARLREISEHVREQQYQDAMEEHR